MKTNFDPGHVSNWSNWCMWISPTNRAADCDIKPLAEIRWKFRALTDSDSLLSSSFFLQCNCSRGENVGTQLHTQELGEISATVSTKDRNGHTFRSRYICATKS